MDIKSLFAPEIYNYNNSRFLCGSRDQIYISIQALINYLRSEIVMVAIINFLHLLLSCNKFNTLFKKTLLLIILIIQYSTYVHIIERCFLGG